MAKKKTTKKKGLKFINLTLGDKVKIKDISERKAKSRTAVVRVATVESIGKEKAYNNFKIGFRFEDNDKLTILSMPLNVAKEHNQYLERKTSRLVIVE